MGLVPTLLFAQVSTISLENGSKALQYLPKQFDKTKTYPLIIALHGMGEYTRPTLKKWIPVADRYGYILICPIGSNFQQGFTKKPQDDRHNFLLFKQDAESRFSIDGSQSILAGFSRGGSYAIETGILYPEHFPNIISMFGYFNDSNNEVLSEGKDYSSSHIYIMTGLGDYSELSSSKGYKALQENGFAIQLEIINHLYHAYPKDFVEHFQGIRTWIISKNKERFYAIH